MTEPEIDIPDDFDLDEARQSRSTTDPEEMPACPECGSRVVRYRIGASSTQKPQPRGNPKLMNGIENDYKCGNCYATFDEAEADTPEADHIDESR